MVNYNKVKHKLPQTAREKMEEYMLCIAAGFLGSYTYNINYMSPLGTNYDTEYNVYLANPCNDPAITLVSTVTENGEGGEKTMTNNTSHYMLDTVQAISEGQIKRQS